METAATTSTHRVATTTAELIIRRRVRLRAPRYLFSTEQCLRNFARGSFSLRPSRATNAGHWGKEWYAW